MSATGTRFIGAPIKRREDQSLLTGAGTYVDNMTVPGMVWMSVVRSPYAHARVTRIDLDAARAADGVVAVFSGSDLRDAWAGSLPCAWPVTEDMKSPPHYPLTPDEARYQGDGVAVVIAESRVAATDAAELVDVDYEPLGVSIDVARALDDDAPLVHGDLGTNECYVWKLETDDFDEALGSADAAVIAPATSCRA